MPWKRNHNQVQLRWGLLVGCVASFAFLELTVLFLVQHPDFFSTMLKVFFIISTPPQG
jgi:hypothetical protein